MDIWIDGVSVTLSSGAATTTSGGGHYSFLDVEGGTYTITISGFPADASFNATTAEVTIASAGQSAAANFSGAWIRTASLMGMVTVEGEGLPGITVSITGRQDAQMLTDDNGQYTFTGLRAGNYTVEITGYDAMGVAFSATSSAVTVGAGESKVWSFDGTYVRESAISGQVSVEGNGLSDVTVSLRGMGSENEQMTDAGGQYTFSNLRAGVYQLAISGYETDEYGFSTTSATVRVEHGRTANVPFEGILLRTATIMGQVSIEGEGLADVTVSLSGEGESLTTMTDAGGQYTFSELPAGNFAVGISGYDTDDYSFETTSKNVAVALGGTATVPFEGILLRTSGIAGRVSVDGMGIEDVTVTLSGDDLEAPLTAMTDATGQYAIAGLAEGDYTVAISGYDAVEYAFEDSQDVTLAKDATAIVNFTGKKLRTAEVMVTVTADGTGVPGVGATLIHITNLATQSGDVIAAGATGADGSYTFGDLLAGAYAVQISGADEEIDFLSTTLLTQVATDATAEVNFPGRINRTASIGGMVTVDGAGKAGVMVALGGGDDNVSMSMETGDDGGYSFGGLRRGSYTVSITNPNEAMYSFASTSRGVSVGVGQVQDDISFAGSLIAQSSISGTVTVEGEALEGVTVTLGGDGDDTRTTGANGVYNFDNLATGSYTVTIANPDAEEYSFASMSEDVDLGNTDDQTRNFMARSLRTASITVMVTAEGAGVASAVATLTKTTGKSEADRTGATAGNGAHTFDNLVAGTYQVAISGTDEEIDFADGTGMTVDAVTDEDADAAFAGTYNRTATIGGNVTIDGAGMAGVMVALSGGDDDVSESMETLDNGSYSFPELRRGEYTVSITNPDDAMYSFTNSSRDVNLGLGQVQDDVSFAGSLIQQSSISGTVTVEGEALPGVTVTLGGDGDDTQTTGDNGAYDFDNLGSGTYTVTIANPDDAAYIFDTEPVTVELGNTDRQTRDFGGTHTREASITGMLFVDEGTPNNLHDEGEHTLAAEGIKVTLVGPTLLRREEKETNADGMFTFDELRQGDYQLMLSSPGDAVMDDFLYGGDASYDIEVGVGADGGGTQNLPYDITHQTINFTVNLKRGDEPLGDALPGAMVTLYSDAAGELKIAAEGTGETDADGEASLRFERDGKTGNTVYAAIAAPAGDYDADEAMQAITWNSQYRMTDAANDGDIVNLKADFSFSGATITTDFGGGEALGEWAISVSSGGDAVDGAPEALGADGTASFSEVVDAADLPKTYTVAVAANQDNDLDGGELYDAGDGLEHTHDGLSLPATMDAGMIEVKYTTQTLKVYVHNEQDQVMGYTGNVLGGDQRMTGVLDIGIRYIEGSGRSRPFTTEQWNPDPGRPGSRDGDNMTDADGVVTFKRVPAEYDVIVQVEVNDGHNVVLLGPDELDAYTGDDANGMTGGAFGDMSGGNHTVELCPLMSGDGDQRHDACGTFAFVNTYEVTGQVWQTGVTKPSDGGFSAEGPLPFNSVTVSMDPEAGENLAFDMGESAGDADSYASGNVTTTHDGIHFDWDQKAAGVYKLKPIPGWTFKVGAPGDAVAFDGDLDPLGDDLQIDVSPTTGYAYGIVTDEAGFPVDDATVTIDGKTDETDDFGRYIIRGFRAGARNVVVDADDFARKTVSGNSFAANTPEQVDVQIGLPTATRLIEGTVRSGGEPVSGVEIKVDGAPPRNPNTKSSSTLQQNDIYHTDENGWYSVEVVAGGSVEITAHKRHMSFAPASHSVSVAVGDSPLTGWDFTAFDYATISGRVQNEAGGPMAGVTVTATPEAGGDAVAEDVTDVRGVYGLRVPFGRYTVAASLAGYSFGDDQDVNVGPDETKSLDNFEATRELGTDATLSALMVDGTAVDADEDGNYAAEVANNVTMATIAATATDENAEVTYSGTDADETTDGHQVALDVGDENVVTVTVTPEDPAGTAVDYTVKVTRAHAVVTLSATPNPVTEGGDVTVTASVDHAQAEEFTVMVTVPPAEGTMGDNAVLTFAADATTSTGVVTVTQTDNDTRDDPALTVTISGSTTNTDVADIEDVEIAVTDDEMVASAPRNLAVTVVGDQTASVTWSSPSQIGTDAIASYEWELTGGTEGRRFGSVTDLTSLPLILGGDTDNNALLTNGVEYTFSVFARSDLGDGDAASTMVKTQPVITLEIVDGTGTGLAEGADPGADPAEEGDSVLAVVSVSSASIEDIAVTVMEIVGDDAKSEVTIAGGSIMIPAGETMGADTAVIKAKDDLVDDDDANGMVQATATNATDSDGNDGEEGQQPTSITITDNDEVPGAPALTVRAGDAQLTLEWISPGTTGTSDITMYQVRYRLTTGDDFADAEAGWARVGDGNARTHTITGLTNDSGYTVQVRAVSAAGGGAAAEETGTPAAPSSE